MNTDHAPDYLVWDNTQAVLLERSSQTRGKPVRVGVGTAKRRNIRTAQRSPSGGVYLGAEATWHLPRVELPDGVIPLPRDVIIEDVRNDGVGAVAGAQAETRWTILSVARNRQGETYACGCVDLVVAHGLADRITIEKPTYHHTPSGAQEKVWDGPATTLRARVQEVARDIAEERGARYGRLRYDVIVERQSDVDVAEDRVRWTDSGKVRYLDILRLRNPERIDELPVLECELR